MSEELNKIQEQDPMSFFLFDDSNSASVENTFKVPFIAGINENVVMTKPLQVLVEAEWSCVSLFLACEGGKGKEKEFRIFIPMQKQTEIDLGNGQKSKIMSWLPSLMQKEGGGRIKDYRLRKSGGIDMKQKDQRGVAMYRDETEKEAEIRKKNEFRTNMQIIIFAFMRGASKDEFEARCIEFNELRKQRVTERQQELLDKTIDEYSLYVDILNEMIARCSPDGNFTNVPLRLKLYRKWDKNTSNQLSLTELVLPAPRVNFAGEIELFLERMDASEVKVFVTDYEQKRHIAAPTISEGIVGEGIAGNMPGVPTNIPTDIPLGGNGLPGLPTNIPGIPQPQEQVEISPEIKADIDKLPF